MRIAIVGAGGVGGLLGGLLARSGEDVVVVARGKQLDAIRRQGGIRVHSPLGTFTQRLAGVEEDPRRVGAVDAVLVAVKAWQVSEVAPSLAPLVERGGVVVPLQNGVEAAERLEAPLGKEPVVGGVISCIAWIDSPGGITHVGAAPRLGLGERGERAGKPSARLEPLAAALQRAGCEASVVADVECATWEKLLLVEPWGIIGAVSRAPIGALRALPPVRSLHVQAMNEVARLARARGVALPEDAIERILSVLDAVPADATASMQRDIGAARPSELDDQTGAVVRLARAAGVSVPVHEALHTVLVPQEASARGRIPRFART